MALGHGHIAGECAGWQALSHLEDEEDAAGVGCCAADLAAVRGTCSRAVANNGKAVDDCCSGAGECAVLPVVARPRC